MPLRDFGKLLYYYRRPNRFSNGLGAILPEEYKKFWKEWKHMQPTAVHYIEEKGNFKLDPDTQKVVPVQNAPIPLKYPEGFHQGIWGGEAVIQGFTRKNVKRRRVPHFWFPHLRKMILYSEILDEYMRVTVTNRTMKLIHENYGFDHYILKTPACDLKSELALKIKRKLLVTLADKTLYPDDEEQREEIYQKYKQYLESYTRKEIDWYGLTFKEALRKIYLEEQAKIKVEPLKIQYRKDLVEKLKQELPEEIKTTTSWLSVMNPFAKSTTSK